MKINIKNRKTPVFFVFKFAFILGGILALASCKSQNDWRTKYKDDKAKSTVKTTVAIPKNTSDYSKILDVNESDLDNKKLYNFITKWYATPYKFGGTTQKGIDCSAFTVTLYKEIYDIELPRVSKDIATHIKRKYTNKLQEGDLVFFAFGNSKEINHVGIYLHNNKFVHASTSKGVIISDLTEPWYGNYLVKCGVYKKR